MLQSINDRIKGVLGWLVVALISVPFALWGIQSYLGGGADKFMARVNDVEITVPQFDRAVAQQRARMQQMFGNMPITEAYDQLIKDEVLNQLITTEVLKQYAAANGYVVSDQSLAAAIQSIGVFHENGKFSPELYEKVLGSQGMSAAGFEALYRQDLSISQVRDTVAGSAFVTDAGLIMEWKLKNQKRKVGYVEFKTGDYLKNVSASDTDIETQYNAAPERYMTPEMMRVSYLELKAEDLASNIPVNEDELKKRYQEYVKATLANEQRKASHILISVAEDAPVGEVKEAESKIREIESKLKAGADFAALAKEYSQDEGSASEGGDLGLVSHGMMVKPFEEALFALNENQVSDIVRTEFGFHLIKLKSIKKPVVQTFDERRAELVKEQKENTVQNLFIDKSEKLANLSYENPEGLDLVADQLGLKVKTSELFTRTSGKGIASSDKVRAAAFSNEVLKDGLNSEAIEVSNRHVVVVRLNEYKEAKVKPLSDVKALIKAQLENRQARMKTIEAAEALNKKLLADSSVASWNRAAEEQKNNYQVFKLLGRENPDVAQPVLERAFKLPRPESGAVSFDQVTLANGNTIVLAVSDVVEAKGMPAKAELDELRAKQGRSFSGQEFEAFIAAIKSKADIFIPEKSN